jgi:C4-dicarboxylate-specific signal transduction histidine kinase
MAEDQELFGRESLMATLGMMTTGLAHEINQPLQTILSVAQNCASNCL